MKAFKDGDFIVNPNRTILYIMQGSYEYFIKYQFGSRQHIGMCPMNNLATFDYALPSDIQTIMATEDMPQWVDDILIKAGKAPYGNKFPSPSPCPMTMPKVITDSFGLSSVSSKPAAAEPLSALAVFRANCPHKWKLYVGFSAVFEFCSLCDERRNG